MASPLGHALAGYALAAGESRAFRVPDLKRLLLYMFVANAPDLDFIPGLLLGKPNLFHHGVSHSIVAGILFSGGISLSAFLWGRRQRRIVRTFLVCFALYSSHLLLDYLAVDRVPPAGIPIFWPVWGRYFLFPHPLLPAVAHAQSWSASIGRFLAEVFSVHNLTVMGIELIAGAAAVSAFVFTARIARQR